MQFRCFSAGSVRIASIAFLSAVAAWPRPAIIVGANHAPPFYDKAPDGPVRGLAVDTLNEASRRCGLQIQWRFLDGTPDKLLVKHDAEMWPVLAITPERQKIFHMTDPWLRNSFALVSRKSKPVVTPDQTSGFTVAYFQNARHSQMAYRFFPSSILSAKPTRGEVFSSVCEGSVIAGFMELRSLEHLLLERPQVCASTALAVHTVKGAEQLMAIAAVPERADDADRLLRAIVEMSKDRSLDAITLHWTVFGANETSSVAALYSARKSNRVVIATAVGLLLAALALVWLFSKSRKTSKALRQEMAQRSQAESAQQLAFAQIAHQANHDALTGLPNRSAFDRRLPALVDSCAASHRRIALAYLDLDRFKQANDALGHAAGDELLQQLARRLDRALPDGASLFRLSGDEFTFFVHVGSVDHAHSIAESIGRVAREPFAIAGTEWSSLASIGVALYPDHAQTAVELLRNAEAAMYQAKRAGNGSVVMFEVSVGQKAERWLEVERALRRGLQRNVFTLAYQPQYGADERLCGFEALLRLTDLELGSISPAEFIPVAEESRLIVPIGEWVLAEACRQSVRWESLGAPAPRLAVNVSALQLKRPDFVATIDRVLLETGARATLLDLELTETALAEGESVRASLLALKNRGVRVSVDDFGTGYSSLSSLHLLPVYAVKIDRTFVRDTASPFGTLPFVRAIVVLARSLAIEVVAEGVETVEQLDAVRSSGCDLVQGYFYARPMSAEEATALLESRRAIRAA